LLRELYPSYRVDRVLLRRYEPRKQSIVAEHPRLARSLPRLVNVEICFDMTIQICRERDPSWTVAEWAQVVGRWFAGCLYAELAAGPPPSRSPASRRSSWRPEKGREAERRAEASAVLYWGILCWRASSGPAKRTVRPSTRIAPGRGPVHARDALDDRLGSMSSSRTWRSQARSRST
jgi:hypothetical protein